MLKSPDLPDCFYPTHPILIPPTNPTPEHSLYLSNLDDQNFLRFSIKYLYLFEKSVTAESLKLSLSRVLVDYYPLAGRLRASHEDDQKLEVYCNGQGALFAEAFMDITAQDFLQFSELPNRSWRKLLYKVPGLSFLDIPPLVVQVTNLRCGGMILCTAINHCLCDGIGTSQFLNAWAHITSKSNSDVPILPFHNRHVLKSYNHYQITSLHPAYTKAAPTNFDVLKFLQSQPLIPTSFTFTPSHILRLKRQCAPFLKCTAFEVLASHTWRSWVKSLDLSFLTNVKLLFSVNVRKKVIPEMPEGYYGNGFVLACAQTTVKDLGEGNLRHGVKRVQEAKARLGEDGYIASIVEMLEDKSVKTDLSASLVLSQWSRLGLEELDFGEGKPLHMGPLTSDTYCLFLPVIGDVNSVRVQISVPGCVAEKFECYMKECFCENGGNVNGNHDGHEGDDGNGY